MLVDASPQCTLEVVITSGGLGDSGYKHAGARCAYASVVLGLARESIGSSERTRRVEDLGAGDDHAHGENCGASA